jgi:hypothetical protein
LLATTNLVFSLDPDRNIIQDFAMDNMIQYPNRQPVLAGMFDNNNTGGIALLVADNEGGISFSLSDGCSSDFSLVFDYYLSYPVEWLSIIDNGDGKLGFVSNSSIVTITWVQGLNGTQLGVEQL